MDRNIWSSPRFRPVNARSPSRSNRSVYIGPVSQIPYNPARIEAGIRRDLGGEGRNVGRGGDRLETLATRLDGENLCEKSCYNPNLILWPALRRIVLCIGGLGIMAVYGRV